MNNITTNNNLNFGSLNVINKHRLNPRWTNIEHLYNKTDKNPQDVLKLWLENSKIFYDYEHPTNSLFDSCGVILRDGVEKLEAIKSDSELVKKLQKLVEICKGDYRKTPECQGCIDKITSAAGESKKDTFSLAFAEKRAELRDVEFSKDNIFHHIEVII